MTITRFDEPTHVTLVLEGRIDATTTQQVDAAFSEALAGGAKNFIWDCGGVTYISSAGLRSFLQALKQVNGSGGKLVIAAAPPMVLEVFDISGFRSLLTLEPDRESAAKKLA